MVSDASQKRSRLVRSRHLASGSAAMSRRITIPLAGLALGLAALVAVTAHTQHPPPGTKPPTGNVREHGAKGDGTADDWQAIQYAVDSGAGAVVLPPGTYRI